MDCQKLAPFSLDLTAYRFGMPQQSVALTVVPVFGPEHPARFAAPLSGLKLSQVRGYGNMELANTSGQAEPRTVKEPTRPNSGTLIQRLGDRLAESLSPRTENKE